VEQVIMGALLVLVFELMFVPLQEEESPLQPIAQLRAAAAAIADQRKNFMRPPVCSSFMSIV
jgi:hypothetical protein